MRIILANPRGFCAGVERAIKCVESALEKYGPPVYVLNDIVHNAHVVNELKDKGAVFVKDLKDVPKGSHLLFSAHGVSEERYKEANEFNMEVIDATCPLVEKVHNEARRFASRDYTIVLIGEPGHDETVGTMGWAPEHIKRILRAEEVESLEVPNPDKVSYISQTTLSVEDCETVIAALRKKFPNIQGPPKSDICYATSNRQAAVNQWASEADVVLVVGDVTSGNSNRLVDICHSKGIDAYLIPDSTGIEPAWVEGANTILLTAGASAPERLVQGVINWFSDRGDVEVVESEFDPEDVHFKLPASIA